MGIETALLGGAALSGLGSIVSGAMGSGAANSASQTQSQAAEEGMLLQEQEFNQTQSNIQPFISSGAAAASALSNLTGTEAGGNPLTAPLTATFQPTMAQLAATPGYQFALQQGQLATQSGYAAQGLGQSGAAQKGAANYAEGLASTTYQQQFQNYLQQNQQIATILQNQSNTGAGAAVGGAQVAAQQTNAITGLLTGGAAATAAGTVGSTNALTAGIGGATGAAGGAANVYALINSGMFGKAAA